MLIQYTDFNMENLFKELYDQYSLTLQKNGDPDIKLSFELPDNDLVVRSDYIRVKQILSNLLSNAIKFTLHGSVIYSCEKKGNELLFMVSDTGTGIPEKDLNKIFKRFISFDYDGMNTEGSGIGLSIVEKIVTLLDGRIWFNSAYGVGSNFYFSIPYIPAIKMVSRKENTEVVKLAPNRNNGKSILVVEDDPCSQELMEEILKPLNMSIHSVSDGNEAIMHVIKNQNTSLILMDMKLPVLDGYEAARTIKQLNPGIPIIAQTAYAMAGDREKAINAGCDDYITKPIESESLLRMIDQYM